MNPTKKFKVLIFGLFLLLCSSLTHSLVTEKGPFLSIIQPGGRVLSKNIILKTEDGLEREAILTLRKGAKGNVILCHPASKNKEFMLPYENLLFSEYNCLRFDFRRHGSNVQKQCTTFGSDEAKEVRSAVQFIKETPEIKNLPTYGFGISMGAAALIEAESKEHLFDGLILQSCYEKLRNQIKRMYTFYRVPLMHNLIFRWPSTWIAKRKYQIKLSPCNPIYEISKVNTPIFLIHAQNDSFVPVEATDELAAASSHTKMYWKPEKGGHTKLLKELPNQYAKKCKDFLVSIDPTVRSS